MKTIFPTWLQTIIDDSGTEQGKYSFIDTVTLDNLPKGFVGIAEDGEGGGLVLAVPTEGVVYRWLEGELDTYACDAAEFAIALHRDEAWEALSENMPALKPFWLGIVLKSITDDGKELTLGFKGTSRQSALVIRGRVEAGEMLSDALERELSTTLELDDYEVLDLVDDGGTVEKDGVEEPLFTAVVKVEQFDPGKKIPDTLVGWMELGKKLVN